MDGGGAFIQRVAQTVTHCVNVLSAGNETIQIIQRLESLDRNIVRAGGSLISREIASQLRVQVGDLLAEARKANDATGPLQSGYQAPMTPEGYNIPESQLQFLDTLRFTNNEQSKILGVSESTVKRRKRAAGIARKFTEISDIDLDRKVAEMVLTNRHIGPNSVLARLRYHNINVQRQRVRDSVQRVDPGGAALRSVNSHRLQRRLYAVPGPNSLWHLDGHHKLIR